MRLLAAALVIALSAPAAAAAQRPAEGVPISHRDIEQLDPAAVILDRRNVLKLEKPQIAKLDSIRRAFDDSAKKLADGVRRAQREVTSPPPMLRRPPEGKPETRKDSVSRAKLDSTNRVKRDAYFEKVTTGRRDLADALLALKDLFDATLDQTIKALDGTQHTTAALTLERTSEEFTRRLRLANVR